jgi:hypothetical protein
MLSRDQYQTEANLLGCETEAIMAVGSVESNGHGFQTNGEPKILFEGHIFWRQLLKAGINPAAIQKGNEDILYPVWNLATVRPLYNMDQYQRLNKAKAINPEAALKSASWGAFQIMGFNYAACGYASVEDFVAAQNDEFSQLQCFSAYIKNNHLNVNLEHLDWAGFALAYNGKGYQANHYDTKLKAAYDQYKKDSVAAA